MDKFVGVVTLYYQYYNEAAQLPQAQSGALEECDVYVHAFILRAQTLVVGSCDTMLSTCLTI